MPGDCRAAQNYVHEIERVLEFSAYRGVLSQHDRNNLRALLSKWRRRAEGEDMRFMLLGNMTTGKVVFSDSAVRHARDQRIADDIVGLLEKELTT